MAQGKRKGAGLGLALGAAALASAGAYFLYGSKDAKKNRQKVKSWALKARAEVLEQLEKVKQLDLDQYKTIINNVLKRYSALHGATQSELRRLAAELMGYWSEFEKHQRTTKTKNTRRRRTSSKRKSKATVQGEAEDAA